MKKTWVVLTLFGLFWTVLVSVFDGFIVYGFINQLRAQNFAQVIGHITHSEVTTSNSSKGTMYGVDIQYHYEVAGRPFEGNRFRYLEGASSDSRWAYDAVKRYSLGAQVPVFYNPKNPSESVLSPGLDGSNLVWVLFLSPFNAIMLGLWIGGLSAIRQKFAKSPLGGIRFRQNGSILRVRLPRYPLYVYPIVTAGLLGFIASFPVVFTEGFHPDMAIAESALFLAYGAGFIWFLWELWKRCSGSYDLVVDSDRKTVELPRTFGRKTKLSVDLADIQTLTAESVAHTGNRGRTTYTYVATLSWRTGDPEQGKVAELYKEDQAHRFVAWLRPQLHINTSSEKSESWKSAMPVPDHSKDIS